MLTKKLIKRFCSSVHLINKSSINTHQDGQSIALLELNNPKTRNALSKTLIKDMQYAIEEIRNNSRYRVAILRSANPNMFCAGADLKERKTMTLEESENFVIKLRSTFNEIYHLPIPTIACIDGAALGGGLELALNCDMRITTSTSVLGLVETALAIIPGAGGTQTLPRIVGIAKAKELIFTAQKLTPQEAKDIGLVNYIENDYEAIHKKALELAQKILQNGPIAIKQAKTALNFGMENDLRTGLEIEKILYSKIVLTEDRVEGLKAFAEKRKPVYQGK